MKEIKVNCNFSSRAEQSVNHLSNNFSTSEIYTMVYSTGSYIARLKLEGKFNSANCESYVFNHIEKISNKISQFISSRAGISNKLRKKLNALKDTDYVFVDSKVYEDILKKRVVEFEYAIKGKLSSPKFIKDNGASRM